jgi:hypothetical protein
MGHIAGVDDAAGDDCQLRRKFNTIGSDEAVHIACSPLLVDSATTIGKLGLNFARGGGIARSILGP